MAARRGPVSEQQADPRQTVKDIARGGVPGESRPSLLEQHPGLFVVPALGNKHSQVVETRFADHAILMVSRNLY